MVATSFAGRKCGLPSASICIGVSEVCEGSRIVVIVISSAIAVGSSSTPASSTSGYGG